MLDWEVIRKEYDHMVEQISGTSLNQQDRARLQKKSSQYGQVLTFHDEILRLEKEIAENEKFAEQERGELRELYLEEITEGKKQLAARNRELEDILYPEDARNERSVFLEIRAGAGGQEAALFVADLLKMYADFAATKHWAISIVEASETDLGGYSRLILHVTGKNVYKFLRFESGVHRVQRVPKTETQGRVHTSTVTVAVMPEAEEVEVNINPADLRIDVYRSSGAGGQHVNTTDSAVRITHIPTGVVVTCQDERSQGKNKARAMKVLQARILQAERERHDAEMSAQRKQQVGTGERSEKIRTYNYPQNRITDHRTDVTLKKLDLVMQGDLEDLIMPLLEWDVAERRKKGSFLDS